MDGFVYLLTNIATVCVHLRFVARHIALFLATRITEVWFRIYNSFNASLIANLFIRTFFDVIPP